MKYKNLEIWKRSLELSLLIYNLTKDFPKNESFGLTSQIRRCSVSVPSNIAEGYSRWTTNSFINFLKISLGSLSELDTQLILSLRLKYIDLNNFEKLTKEIEVIQKMVISFIKSLYKKD